METEYDSVMGLEVGFGENLWRDKKKEGNLKIK